VGDPDDSDSSSGMDIADIVFYTDPVTGQASFRMRTDPVEESKSTELIAEPVDLPVLEPDTEDEDDDFAIEEGGGDEADDDDVDDDNRYSTPHQGSSQRKPRYSTDVATSSSSSSNRYPNAVPMRSRSSSNLSANPSLSSGSGIAPSVLNFVQENADHYEFGGPAPSAMNIIQSEALTLYGIVQDEILMEDAVDDGVYKKKRVYHRQPKAGEDPTVDVSTSTYYKQGTRTDVQYLAYIQGLGLTDSDITALSTPQAGQANSDSEGEEEVDSPMICRPCRRPKAPPKGSLRSMGEAEIANLWLGMKVTGCSCLTDMDPYRFAADRLHFEQSKSTNAQTIADAVQASADKVKYRVQDIHGVCYKCWCNYYGVSQAHFRKIKNQVVQGTRINFKRKRRDIPLLASGAGAVAWVDTYSRLYGDFQPDLSEIHLPDRTWKTVWSKYVVEQQANYYPHVEYNRFCQLQHAENPHVRMRKYKRFTQCDTCADFDTKISAATTPVRVTYWTAQKKLHLDDMARDRLRYHKHVSKSHKYPHKYMSITLDGMDHSNTNVPHFLREAKEACAKEKLATHVTGVMIHGHYPHRLVYTWLDNSPSDSNVTITVLLDVLNRALNHRKEKGLKMPEVLYLQLDNCGRENKNQYLLAIEHYLCYIGVFAKIKMSFLQAGHTHEDCDQMFSCFSRALRHRTCMTIPELHDVIRISYFPRPVCVHLDHFGCFNKFLAPYIEKIEGISEPHVFIVKRDADQVIRHYYKMHMRSSTKTEPNCVLPLNREGFTVLSKRNVGFPKIADSSMYGGAGQLDISQMESDRIIRLIPFKSLRLGPLKATRNWIANLAYPQNAPHVLQWWDDLLVQQVEKDITQCPVCVDLRKQVGLCRKDWKDADEERKRKQNLLTATDKELGEHIRDDDYNEFHQPFDFVFPPSSLSLVQQERVRIVNAVQAETISPEAAQVLLGVTPGGPDPDAIAAQVLEGAVQLIGNNAGSLDDVVNEDAPDQEPSGLVNAGVAPEAHYVGARSFEEMRGLDDLQVDNMVIIKVDDDCPVLQESTYWKNRPFIVGKVIRLHDDEHGSFTYQIFGVPELVWKSKYLPGWIDNKKLREYQRFMKRNPGAELEPPLPEEVYTKNSSGREPLVDSADVQMAYMWWSPASNWSGKIPKKIQMQIINNPRYDGPTSNQE
jgi:hypothetical protein